LIDWSVGWLVADGDCVDTTELYATTHLMMVIFTSAAATTLLILIVVVTVFTLRRFLATVIGLSFIFCALLLAVTDCLPFFNNVVLLTLFTEEEKTFLSKFQHTDNTFIRYVF